MTESERRARILRNERGIFLLLNTACALAVGVFVFLLIFSVYPRLRDQTREIQKQRAESVFDACVDSNKRHSNAIFALREILVRQIVREHLVSPEGKKFLSKHSARSLRFTEIEKTVIKSQQTNVKLSVDTTLLLINALRPLQNCNQVVRDTVQKAI
jgi:hypothetical protein